MLAKEISSLQHPIVKEFVQLRTSRRARYEKKQILLLGTKQVEEAPSLEILLIQKGSQTKATAPNLFQVPIEILKKISGQPHPEPLCALATMPPFSNLKGKNKIIALDGVSDPGNVGTLIRTACALGWEGCFLTKECADPFNDKALRASMGATLHLPLQMGSTQELFELAKHFSPLVAHMEGTPIEKVGPIKNPLLILGKEATGVCPEILEAFAHISIPIQTTESLNVAAAGAILMYHIQYER